MFAYIGRGVGERRRRGTFFLTSSEIVVIFGCNCPEAFCKNGAPKNFAKFTGKHQCQNLFFLIKFQASACNFIKKETLVQVNFEKVLRIVFFIEHLRWLPVYMSTLDFWLNNPNNPKMNQTFPLHKKWSFPVRISSVNVTKSAVSCSGLIKG